MSPLVPIEESTNSISNMDGVSNTDVEVESTASLEKPVTEDSVADDVDLDDSTAVKTVRLAINLLTNALIFVTVFVCLVYACRPRITILKLHIILCVLGYQLFMCQGVLMMTKYNSWSVFLKKEQRRHAHMVFQFIGVACVTAGSVLIILETPTHFATAHGGLGFVALIASLLTFVNGIVTVINQKVGHCLNPAWMRIIHSISGSASLGLSAGSLCLAFDTDSFRFWLSTWFNNDDIPAPVLMFMTTLFTFLVTLDFMIPVKKVC